MEERTGESLAVEGVSKSFGAVRAVDDVSFALDPGALTCLIGPNGAGKSTLVHCVAGFLRPEDGRILLGRTDVAGRPPHRRARAGLAIVFQAMRAPQLDVLGATMIGCHTWTRTGFLEGIVRPPWQWARSVQRARRPCARSSWSGSHERADDPADALPLGQLRLLSIARAHRPAPARAAPRRARRRPARGGEASSCGASSATCARAV